MSQKTVTVLGVIAAVMVVLAAYVAFYKPTPDFDSSGVRDLVQGLKPSAIDAIEVRSGEDSVKLTRQGSTFVVSSKLSYPASFKAINRVLDECMKIRTDALVSRDAADHERLGVVDTNEDVQRVRFLDREGELILGLHVAEDESPQGGGYFVRLEGEDAVYHTADYLSFQADDLDYVDKSILDLKRDDIARVQVQTVAGEYSIQSPEAGTVELQGVPEGKQPKGKVYESVFGATGGLNLTGLQSAASKHDLLFESIYEVETRGKAIYRFEIATKAESAADADAEPETKDFVRCSAKYVGPAQVSMNPDADDEEKKRLEALLLAQDAVDAFNQKHQSWIYEVAGYKATNLLKPFDELVEDVPDDARPSEVAASHILIAYEGASRSEQTRSKEEAKARAEEVLARVQAGEDFAELAKEFSDGPSSTKGGDLGTFGFDAMAKPFSEAAFALEVGATSGVVETEFGFHVIKRTK